jgi:very-short-patch-repair endonuclease
MIEPRNLLYRLLDYIGEQAKEIDPRGFRLSTLKGFIERPADLAGMPGIEMDLKVAGDHIWLRVPRLVAGKPPSISESFQGLVRVSDNPNGQLPIADEAALLHRLHKLSEGKTDEERKDLEVSNRAAVTKAVEAYTVLWQSWAEGERPRRKTISLYGDLFALKHQLEAEETVKPQEFVWGIGVGTWKLSFENSPVETEYPILTQTIEISIDDRSMAIEVRPRSTDTRVEFDAVIACQVPGSVDVERAIRDQLAKNRDHPVTPFDSSSYSDVLKLVAGNLDSKGSYLEVLEKGDPVPAAGDNLIVTDSWVLFSRPRSNNYLFEDLKRLQEKLLAGCEIPLGPLSLVTPPSDALVEYEAVRFRGLSSRGSPNGGAGLQELYFPLPYNDEQVTIVQRLEKAPGVCVQGPPGTGKTHTIANIICHYLATGRRVLVTSRGEPALEVLQDKIPEEVRALTVPLLTSDRESMRQFQASIEAIQHQVSQLNPEMTKQQIHTLMGAIDRAHAELGRLDTRVDEIALTQLSDVIVDGKPMRAQKVADLVVAGREQHGWFDDDVNLVPSNEPPLSDGEVAQLRQARRKLGLDLVYASARIPSADALPEAKSIAALHRVLSKIEEIEAQVSTGELLSLKAVTPHVLAAARELVSQIDEAVTLADELAKVEGGWPLALREKCLMSSFVSERAALEAMFTELDALIAARAEFLKRPVELPPAALSSQKTREAVLRAMETGKPFGLIPLGKAEAREHISAMRVAGLTPSKSEDWAHVDRYIRLHSEVLSFTTRWNQFSDDLSIPLMDAGVSNLRKNEGIAEQARKAHKLAMRYDAVLPKKAEAVFERAPKLQLSGSADQLRGVREQLMRHLTRAELSESATELASIREKLAGTTGPISERLQSFVEGSLGNPSLAPELVAADYAELIGELRRIAALSVELAVTKDFAGRVETAGASRLARRVLSESVPGSGEDEVLPVAVNSAWNWARMRSHLDGIESRDELLSLAARRRELESGLARFYREMVAKASWLATKRNASPKVLQALAGYATAIRRIGQGTGPNATRYRRDAREAMIDAAGAVPCWIMSHNKVSESMPPDIGIFDLVIVDEASQSDLWAMPAILRGKRLLIVGDDKQVSPDAGFIAAQRIQELKDRFLPDQPYGIEMTPEKSLYDLAARVFAAQQVMLREHFRCVPPIIAYSNRVFYKGGIQPIRIPRASERIDPPLVDMYVPSGIRDRHDCNGDEAQAIAQEIEALLANEKFANRSLGVVSMLGMEQAKHIDSVVRQRCDAAELMRRRFECGDARTFQGSERDIMFLSLVVDQKNSKAVSGNMFDQRFNVAASRARDRMYLVRSVKLSDLSDKDLRITLLNHFEKPIIVDKEESENLLERCESGFEKQVFSALISKGYRVVPQVKTGAYRLDMVVEGEADTRLAIECDGDEFHGPDRWQHDMNRQRVLERAGWVFWRCFASTWTMRKAEVLDELIERLTSMGIAPVGALDRVPSLVEKRIWKPTNSNHNESEVAQQKVVGPAETGGSEGT